LACLPANVVLIGSIFKKYLSVHAGFPKRKEALYGKLCTSTVFNLQILICSDEDNTRISNLKTPFCIILPFHFPEIDFLLKADGTRGGAVFFYKFKTCFFQCAIGCWVECVRLAKKGLEFHFFKIIGQGHFN